MRRRQAVVGVDADDLPDPRRTDARATLSYLRRHSQSALPEWILRADALDAQTLVIAASWDLWRAELHHLRGGRSDGLDFDQLGEALGLGPVARRTENEESTSGLTEFGRLDETRSRIGRRQAALREANRAGEAEWVRTHAGDLRDVVAKLLNAALRYEITDRGMLNELAGDAGLPTGLIEGELEGPPEFTPISLRLLSLAATEVETAARKAAGPDQPQPYEVRLALDAAKQLRSQFADVSRGSSSTRDASVS